MCSCGRRRQTADVVTSAQTAARQSEDSQVIEQLGQQIVTGAEALLRSASSATRNANS